VTDRLGSNSDPDSGAQFLQAGKTCLSSTEKNHVACADGSSQINEFVEIILNAGLAEDRSRDQADPHITDRKSIRPRASVNMIARLAAASARHVLVDNRRIPRDIFLQ
jgi:hypothetical protein